MTNTATGRGGQPGQKWTSLLSKSGHVLKILPDMPHNAFFDRDISPRHRRVLGQVQFMTALA